MGEIGGEMEEKIQKRETEDQKYRGEREPERKIVEIHRGGGVGTKEMDSGERHRSIDRGKEPQGKRQRGEIERRGRVER